MKHMCQRCKKLFEVDKLTTARNEKGKKPISQKANKYCFSCEEEVYEKAVLKDNFDKEFMKLGYYKVSDKGTRAKYMGLIQTLLTRLENDGYKMNQIRLILTYMIEKKQIQFNENILLLVPYHFKEVSDYHNDLYRISTNESYGYIPPSEEMENNKPAHRPNRKAIKVSNIELM